MALRDMVLGMLPENLQVKILQRVAERNALKAFHELARKSSAYQDFLRRHGIDPDSVRSIEDFRQFVPPITPSYIRDYRLRDRMRNGESPESIVFSSGSTGGTPKTTGLPRGWVGKTAPMIIPPLKEFFDLKGPTLLVTTAYLGITPAGIFMVKLFTKALEISPDLPVEPIYPGYNLEECLKSLKALEGEYEAWILAGMPGFVDILLNTLTQSKYVLPKAIHVWVGGEAIDEEWRQKVEATYHGRVMNMYSSGEAGVTAMETELTLLMRRLAHTDRDIARAIYPHLQEGSWFGGQGFAADPGIYQVPPSILVEGVEEGNLLITKPPYLIRYAIGDLGIVLDYGEALRRLRGVGQDLPMILSRRGAPPPAPMPILLLYGRGDMGTFCGANVYHEQVRNVLNSPRIQNVYGQRLGEFFCAPSNMKLEPTLVSLKSGTRLGESEEEQFRRGFIEELRVLNLEFNVVVSAPGDLAQHLSLVLVEEKDWPEGVLKKLIRKKT